MRRPGSIDSWDRNTQTVPHPAQPAARTSPPPPAAPTDVCVARPSPLPASLLFSCGRVAEDGVAVLSDVPFFHIYSCTVSSTPASHRQPHGQRMR